MSIAKPIRAIALALSLSLTVALPAYAVTGGDTGSKGTDAGAQDAGTGAAGKGNDAGGKTGGTGDTGGTKGGGTGDTGGSKGGKGDGGKGGHGGKGGKNGGHEGEGELQVRRGPVCDTNKRQMLSNQNALVGNITGIECLSDGSVIYTVNLVKPFNHEAHRLRIRSKVRPRYGYRVKLDMNNHQVRKAIWMAAN